MLKNVGQSNLPLIGSFLATFLDWKYPKILIKGKNAWEYLSPWKLLILCKNTFEMWIKIVKGKKYEMLDNPFCVEMKMLFDIDEVTIL